MNEIQFKLLSNYLHQCNKISSKMLDYAKDRNKPISKVLEIAKSSSNIATQMAAIYFFRHYQGDYNAFLKKLGNCEQKTTDLNISRYWDIIWTKSEQEIAEWVIDLVSCLNDLEEAAVYT